MAGTANSNAKRQPSKAGPTSNIYSRQMSNLRYQIGSAPGGSNTGRATSVTSTSSLNGGRVNTRSILGNAGLQNSEKHSLVRAA